MDSTSAVSNGKDRAPRWSLRLLGDFQLSERASGEKVTLPGKRERVFLAYLALSPNGRQPRRKLVTLLWGEGADETSLENLRTSIFNLRKALGDAEHRIVASEDRDIVLDTSTFEVDVLDLRRLAAAPGMAELQGAAQLYAGDFLEGLGIESEEFESWRREEATRCKGQVLVALTRLMDQLAGSGESERAIEEGLRILRLEPLHEAAVRSLMRLYAASGRRATAVELYRVLTEALRKELGAQPEPETRAVYAEITRGNEGQTAAVADAKSPSPAVMACPGDEGSAHSCAEYPLPPIDTGTPLTRQRVNRRTIGWLATGGLALAAALAIVFYELNPRAGTTTVPASSVELAKAASISPAGAIAIAVLPFANLSDDASQEYFSDGITQEIITALARIPDLRVVARGSASQFKGQRADLRAVGQALGATHLIEGTVRKAGTRVRITAQLVKSEDGVNVWVDSYDRDLTDVFAIQEEIATSIAGALRMPLGLRPGEQLVANRAIDPASYEQFLRAKAVLLRGNTAFAEALAILEPLVARNSNYAPAWASLSLAYAFAVVARQNASAEEQRAALEAYLPKAEMAARRAIQLDPDSAVAYMLLADFEAQARRWGSAEDLYAKALTVDPTNPDVLNSYRRLLVFLARVKPALARAQQLHEFEPFIPIYSGNLAEALWLDGQDDAAIALYKDNLGRAGAGAGAGLARAYAALGRYQEAAEVRSRFPPPILNGERRQQVTEAIRLLRSAPAKSPSPETLPGLGNLGFVYLHIGAPGRALEFYEQEVFGNVSLLWHPSYAPVRKMEPFKALVRRLGLADYWRERGWPEFCRPTTADDFVCD